MFDVLISYSLIAAVLLTGEVFGKVYLKERPEFTRKLIHILGGITAVVLAQFMSFQTVALVATSGAILIMIFRKLNFLGGLYSVSRQSWGEVLFPLGVALTALLADSVQAYTFGILALTIGDTAAAYAGLNYAKKFYKVFGSKKSLIGSLTLALTVAALGAVISLVNGDLTAQRLFRVALIGLFCAVIECFSVNGSDNITLPLAATLSWNLLI